MEFAEGEDKQAQFILTNINSLHLLKSQRLKKKKLFYH